MLKLFWRWIISFDQLPVICFHRRMTCHDRNDEMRMKKLFEGNSTSKCYASRRQETRSWNRIWRFQQSKYHTYHSLTASYLPKFSRRTKVHLKLHEKIGPYIGLKLKKAINTILSCSQRISEAKENWVENATTWRWYENLLFRSINWSW